MALGQGLFSFNATISASITNHVGGVAVDPATGKVFVVDTSSNRILRFGSAAALISGSSAEAEFGQPNFTSGSANAGGAPSAKSLHLPEQVHIDSNGRMWVVDGENNRVLRFDNASTKANSSDADGVLGQQLMTTNGAGTTVSCKHQRTDDELAGGRRRRSIGSRLRIRR